MKLSRTFLFSASLLLITYTLAAQDHAAAKSDTSSYKAINTKKNEINFLTSNVFGNFRNGLLYRHYTNSGALRLGFVGNGSIAATDPSGTQVGSANQIKSDNENYSISPKVGYEWRKGEGRIKLLYGVDVIYNYSRSYRNTTDTDPISTYERSNIQESYSHSVGLAPLVGFNVRFLKNLSFGFETSIYGGYQISENSTKTNSTDPNAINPNTYSGQKTKGISYSAFNNPIITLGYKF